MAASIVLAWSSDSISLSVRSNSSKYAAIFSSALQMQS